MLLKLWIWGEKEKRKKISQREEKSRLVGWNQMALPSQFLFIQAPHPHPLCCLFFFPCVLACLCLYIFKSITETFGIDIEEAFFFEEALLIIWLVYFKFYCFRISLLRAAI